MKFILIFFFISPVLAKAESQYSNLDFLPLQCDLKIDNQNINMTVEKQQINSRYHIDMIEFQKQKKKYTLSALGSLLDGKCLAYFYAFNPETELFQMRLSYSESANQLKGKLMYQKDQEKWHGTVTCQLQEKDKETLPIRCTPSLARQQKEKLKKKKKKIYQLSPLEQPTPSQGAGSKSAE